MRLRAPPPDALSARALDGLTAVYHRQSGITHLLASPAPEILAALAPAPLSLDELLAHLAAAHDVADADRDGLAARVQELVDAGLVAPA